MSVSHTVVYACRDCAPDWGELTIPIIGRPALRECDVCAKLGDANNFTFRIYTRSDIFYLNKCIDQAELNTRALEEKIRLLETHIEFAPGGEGALQALYSFTEHLQKGSIDAERPVSEHTQEE